MAQSVSSTVFAEYTSDGVNWNPLGNKVYTFSASGAATQSISDFQTVAKSGVANTWQFRLRQSWSFSGGSPFTAPGSAVLTGTNIKYSTTTGSTFASGTPAAGDLVQWRAFAI